MSFAKYLNALLKTGFVIGICAFGLQARASGGNPPSVRLKEVITKNELAPGAFEGLIDGNAEIPRVHMILSEVKERPGSFLAALIQLSTKKIETTTEVEASVYIVDPLEDGRYMMTPFTAGYSSLGLFNDNPTLTLSLSHDRIQVSPINDNKNAAGIKKSITFLYDSKLKLRGAAEGVYTTAEEKNFKKAFVAKSGDTMDLDVKLKSGLDLSGKFGIKRAVGDVMVLKGIKVSAYGEEPELKPQALAFFVDVNSFDGRYEDTLLILTDIAGSGGSTGLKMSYCKKFDDQRCTR